MVNWGFSGLEEVSERIWKKFLWSKINYWTQILSDILVVCTKCTIKDYKKKKRLSMILRENQCHKIAAVVAMGGQGDS